MPRSRAKRIGPEYEGYSKAQRKGYYVNPDGQLFRIGWLQRDDTVTIEYLSKSYVMERNPPLYIKKEFFEKMYEALYGEDNRLKRVQKEEQFVAAKKQAIIDREDALYRPGGIGYLFLKHSTKVGKKMT